MDEPKAGPVQFSGVVPSLAQIADLGPPRSELGVGCLMPWQGKLYVQNYVSHLSSSGTGSGLRIIDEDFTMLRHPDGVDGTYANRMVHHPSNQLIIGPHVVDREHNVRTVEEFKQVRLGGSAEHLTDPQNRVYMLGMEGELFEMDVHSLQVTHLCDLTRELGTAEPLKCHFKDCYTSCGRLVVVNNDYAEADFLGKQAEGTLAEFDGENWTVLERKPFSTVSGLGSFGHTIFATGWDRASAILKVFTGADKTWRTYRLPKASHLWDHKWATEWPRIRATEHERLLMDCHGMFYQMSPWAYGGSIWGIKPISTHLWVLGDFCSWRGLLCMGADNASYESGGNLQCAEPQSGLWFGKTDDLWQFGKPSGWGGPWWEEAVRGGRPSDPYLMTGFDKKCLHLTHDASCAISFAVEVDFLGNGAWRTYDNITVPARGYVHHEFPDGFSAHWVRVTANYECRATAYFTYT
jgi:hypothetical protein